MIKKTLLAAGCAAAITGTYGMDQISFASADTSSESEKSKLARQMKNPPEKSGSDTMLPSQTPPVSPSEESCSGAGTPPTSPSSESIASDDLATRVVSPHDSSVSRDAHSASPTKKSKELFPAVSTSSSTPPQLSSSSSSTTSLPPLFPVLPSEVSPYVDWSDSHLFSGIKGVDVNGFQFRDCDWLLTVFSNAPSPHRQSIIEQINNDRKITQPNDTDLANFDKFVSFFEKTFDNTPDSEKKQEIVLDLLLLVEAYQNEADKQKFDFGRDFAPIYYYSASKKIMKLYKKLEI